MRVLASIIAAVLLLAGCGGSSKVDNRGTPSASTSTAAPVAASTTPTTTPTAAPKPARPAVLTRAQAATRYLAIVKPYNDLRDDVECTAIDDFYINGGTWPPNAHPEWDDRPIKVAVACFKRWVPIVDKQIKDIQATAWPTDAGQDVADLISLTQADLHCFRQGLKATSAQDVSDVYTCFPKDDGSADRARARFGLPDRNQG